MIFLPDGTPHLSDDEIQRAVVRNLQSNFSFDISTRITVRSDVNQFNWKEDESVWEQLRGRRANYHEIYWDGTWVCDFTDDMPVRQTVLRFLKGWSALYEQGKVSVNTEYEVKEYERKLMLDDIFQKELKKQQDALTKAETEIEKMPETTEEDRLSKEVLKEIVKEKKTKKKIKKLGEI